MEAIDCGKVLKALGEDTRIKIFEMLRCGKLCACKILEKLQITQPTLSHHMKILCDSGVVTAEKDRKWTYYSVNGNVLKEVLDFLGCCLGDKNASPDCCGKNSSCC